MADKSQKLFDYINGYNKQNRRSFQLSFSKERDSDVIDALEKQESKTDYVRRLILKDLRER